MKPLIPWDLEIPNRKYIPSVATDIRKTFAAAREKAVRKSEAKKRREIKLEKSK